MKPVKSPVDDGEHLTENDGDAFAPPSESGSKPLVKRRQPVSGSRVHQQPLAYAARARPTSPPTLTAPKWKSKQPARSTHCLDRLAHTPAPSQWMIEAVDSQKSGEGPPRLHQIIKRIPIDFGQERIRSVTQCAPKGRPSACDLWTATVIPVCFP